MILTLVREQLRAQRTALIWTAVVVAAAMGFSTYTLVTGATRAATNAYAEDFRPVYMPKGAVVRLTDLGAAGSIDDYGTATTTSALDRHLAATNDGGSDAWAAASEWGTVATLPAIGRNQELSGVTIMATWGATPWETILAEGRAPLAGEIVLPARVARELNVGIGDDVEILHPSASPGPALATQTVSGIAYDTGEFGPRSFTPAYLAGADARAVAEISVATGAAPRAIQANAGWSTPGIPIPTDGRSGWQEFRGPALMASTALAPLLVAVTLTVGTLIMAFAVGRTQAAARVQWTATARALGARRSHLLGAGAVEGATLFAIALAGAALGLAASHLEHVAWRRSLVAPPPVDVNLPWWLLLGLVALALVLAAASAAIPAVLATRVPPTAALKATAATDELELSRRVPVWPLGLGLAAAWIFLLQPLGEGAGREVVWNIVAIAGGLLVIAFVIEMARRGAETAGQRWQHSSRPWQVYAGTMLGGHPRQAAALASIHFFALLGVAGVLAAHGEGAMNVLEWQGANPSLVGALIASPYGLPVIAVLLAVATLCAAIIASSFKASAAERELAAALGLQPRDLRRAHAYTWAAAQAAGAFAGALAGTALVGNVLASQSADAAWGFLSYEVAGRLLAFGASVSIALVAGLLAALLSAAVAMGSVRATPSRSLRPMDVTS